MDCNTFLFFEPDTPEPDTFDTDTFDTIFRLHLHILSDTIVPEQLNYRHEGYIDGLFQLCVSLVFFASDADFIL
jgi:hypothetical protein